MTKIIPYSGGVGIPEGTVVAAPTTAPKKARRRAQPRNHSDGMVVRFSPIRGVTPKSALAKKIWLPATLNTVSVAESALHNEYDTISAGHFSQPAMGPASARQFRTTSLDSIVADMDAPWFVTVNQDPYDLRVRLSEILRHRKPVHLLATFHPHPDTHPEIDMYVTFRSISKDVRVGERESRYLTIAISEWRDPIAQRRAHAESRSRGKWQAPPTTHVIAASDTLGRLAYLYYGRYADWRYIRDANGISKRFGQLTPIAVLGGHFNIGKKLKIPKLPARVGDGR